MTTIYSGYYTQKPKPQWVNKATKKQAHWAINNNYNYYCLTDMNKWVQHYPHHNTYNFGSLIKLLALEKFIQSEEQTFIWFDMDIYPTQKAYEHKIPEGHDLLYYYHRNRKRDITNQFIEEKYAWAQYNPQPTEYLELSSSFMILTKPTAQSIWNFINKDHNINTKPWWDAYLQKQTELSPQNPTQQGNDEAIFEEWLNKHTPNPKPIRPPHDYQCPPTEEHSPTFIHYHMKQKDLYPND